MEDKTNEQNPQKSGGGVRSTESVKDVSNPINSGGEKTLDTENKAAVAQTRSPTDRQTRLGSKKFITGSDADGQV